MTVIGGYKGFHAKVSIASPSKIIVSYRYVDHFGVGVDDSGKWYFPGVPGMYYLQHYKGQANKYRPFVWDVDITRIINR